MDSEACKSFTGQGVDVFTSERYGWRLAQKTETDQSVHDGPDDEARRDDARDFLDRLRRKTACCREPVELDQAGHDEQAYPIAVGMRTLSRRQKPARPHEEDHRARQEELGTQHQ